MLCNKRLVSNPSETDRERESGRLIFRKRKGKKNSKNHTTNSLSHERKKKKQFSSPSLSLSPSVPPSLCVFVSPPPSHPLSLPPGPFFVPLSLSPSLPPHTLSLSHGAEEEKTIFFSLPLPLPLPPSLYVFVSPPPSHPLSLPPVPS